MNFGMCIIILILHRLKFATSIKNYNDTVKIGVILDSQSNSRLNLDLNQQANYKLLKHFEFMFNISMQFSFIYCNTTSLSLKEVCILDKLISGEVDISTYPMLLTKNNLKLVDFATLSVRGSSTFIFRQPKLSYITNVYKLPFDIYVWYASLLMIVLLTIFLYLIIKWEWHKARQRKSDAEIEELHATAVSDSLIEVVFLTIGAICQQGAERTSRTLPGRIVMFFLFTSLMFLYTSYSANIVALLQSTSTRIKSLKDLLESPLETAIHDNEIYRHLIPSIQGAENQAILQKTLTHDSNMHFMNLSNGIDKVRTELFAFLVKSSEGYSFIEKVYVEEEKCGLEEIQFSPYETDLYIPVSKLSTFKQLFRVGFLKLQELGLQNREITMIQTPKPFCWTSDSAFVSIGIIDCYFPLAMYAGVVVISFMLFTIEFSLHKVKQQH